MRTISARSLLDYTTDELWDMLNGEFKLKFDNGEVIETNVKETLYSQYGWTFHRIYKNTPLLPIHHIKTIIKNNILESKTHLILLGNCMWSTYNTYVNEVTMNGISEVEFRDGLAEIIYRLTNEMYNGLTTRLEDYVVSLDIVDFINITNNHDIKNANDTIEPTQKSIDDTYKSIKNVLYNSNDIINNPITLAVRSKLVSIDQLLQCVSARGFITDTDSVIFPIPITDSYTRGLRYFYDSFIESRSAAKSLTFSKTPLQQAEYFSRRLQLMSQIVQNLHMGDCGSTEYLLWHIRDAVYDNGTLLQICDLDQLSGKYYLDTDKKLKVITANSKELIGRTLKIRTAIHCAHPDPYGVCSTCFGELSYSVPADTNLGQICCTSLAQKSSQKVLSVKHLDGSSVVVGITLTDYQKKFLKVALDNNTYMLSDDLKRKPVKLIIPSSQASNITDVMEVEDVTDLNITRLSEISELGIMVGDDLESFDVSVNKRLASMTYSLLKYIKIHGWSVDEKGNYVIDMKEWDWSRDILTLPLKHYSMSQHSSEISKYLESSVDMLKERDQFTSAGAALVELFDLINSKLSVNLAVIEIVLYASMVVSAEDNDFSLPKPFTKSGLGVMKLTMANRSLSASMAYEGHRQVIVSPYSFINTNRTEHILDNLLVYQDN